MLFRSLSLRTAVEEVVPVAAPAEGEAAAEGAAPAAAEGAGATEDAKAK